MRELAGAGTDFEVAYHDTTRFVKHVSTVDDSVIGPAELQLDGRGSFTCMKLASQPADSAAAVPADHVNVAVYAVGLNFKDVLNVLTPTEAGYIGSVPNPGSDFAGVVTAVPESGSAYAVGDRVFGLTYTRGMLRSNACVPVACLEKMPHNTSFVEAAQLPTIFLTVAYALGTKANLKKGDRILIHAAAGGVGLAAIQYAQSVGAEIFATASPSKHDFLRSLGVSHISTSRDAAKFAMEMRACVGKRGIDVVLNSLTSGTYIEDSVALMSSGGRFIELAKRNIWTEEKMRTRRDDIKYVTHSFNELMWENPAILPSMLGKLRTQFEAGEYQPIAMKLFNFKFGLKDAFRFIRSGQHIGKVVVQMRNDQKTCETSGPGVSIVTGGLGGLGLVAAGVLLELGAKHVVLVSRNGSVRKYSGQRLEERLADLQKDSRISVATCDMSSEADVCGLLQTVRSRHGTIGTVIHASGIIADALLSKQGEDTIEKVFSPKARGAWFLHKHTLTGFHFACVIFSWIPIF